MEAEAASASGRWWTWNAAEAVTAAGACLLLIVIVHVAARVADALWWRPRRLEAHFARQGVRGPPYRFLLGCVTEMVALMAEAAAKPMSPPDSHDALPRVLAFYHYWRKIYGPMFLIWFGPTPRLTVADPELVREVLLTNADAFDRYEAHPVVRKLEGDGLFSLHDDKWALHRRVLTPAFYPDNLNRLAPHVSRSVAALAERWRAMASAAPGGEVELDVAEWYQAVAEETIAHATFGRSYDSGRVVFRMQARLMAFASEAFRKVFVPGYRFLPTKKNRLQWSLDREIRRGLVTLIGNRSLVAAARDDDDDAELNDKQGSSNGGFRDLLGFMINANDKKEKKAAPAIPVEDMLEECKTFFFAGKQTTTNLLTWATVLLAMHPDWQERARQEVLAVCGGADELPSKEHLPRLKTVHMHFFPYQTSAVPFPGGISVIPLRQKVSLCLFLPLVSLFLSQPLGMILNETLRLYPPAVAMIRRAMRDVTLGGVSIPRDTELLIPIMAMHHDATLWGPDATQFNPARFARGGASRAATHPLAFIPFGLGPRMCIGQNLALLEAKLTLAVVLQRFTLARSPSYVHAPTVLMLLYPQYGAPVIFRPVVPVPSSQLSDGASTTETIHVHTTY